MVKHKERERLKDPEMTTEIKQLVIPTPPPHSHGIWGFRGTRGAAVYTKEDQCVCDGGGLGLLHGVNNQGCLLYWRLHHPLKRYLEMGWTFGVITMTRDHCQHLACQKSAQHG